MVKITLRQAKYSRSCKKKNVMKDLEKKGDTALASFPLLGCNTGNQELQIEKTNSCFHRDNI